MYGYGNIISIIDKQVKNKENVNYSTSEFSTKVEKDNSRVMLVMDKYTLHASNSLKLSFIPCPGLPCSQG
jgi:RNA binding exosome subunit